MAQLTTSYQELGSKYLGNTGYGNVYLKIYARITSEGYDIANNRTKVYAKSTLVVEGNGNYFYSSSGTNKSISCTGLTGVSNANANGQYSQGETLLNEISGYVTHNNDGTKTITASASWSSTPWGWSGTASGSATLPPIPRYATCNQSVKKVTESTIEMNWSSDSVCDYLWYRIFEYGEWYALDIADAKSGTYVINEVLPNRTYLVQTRVRRKDSGLTTDSGRLSVTTYEIPKLVSAPNFNDEDNPTITYSNSLGNDVLSLKACISLTGSADDIKYRDLPKTGTSYTFNLTEEERKVLRQATTTSNSRNVKFFIKSQTQNKVYDSILERQFVIVNANPIFTDFDWQTTNHSNLTGDNKTVIKGYSTVRTIIDDIIKAQPQKEATLKSYQTTIGTKSNSTTNLSYPIQYDIANADGATIQVFATDSRDNSTQVVKPVTNFIDYQPLKKTPLQVSRTQQVNSEVNLHFEGEIDLVNFGALENLIRDCYYEYKEASSNENFIQGETVLTPILTQIEGTRYKIEIDQNIKGDLGAEGFDINNSYLIKISVFDRLSFVDDTATLGTGSPAVAMYKNCVSLGAPYNESEGGRVQIKGKNFLDSVYPVGSIFSTNDNTDPNVEFGGTWSKIKTYTGGELIGYATAENQDINYTVKQSNETLAFSDTVIPRKKYFQINYVDEVLKGGAGAIYVKTKNIVGFVEANCKISGHGTAMGFWWEGNANDLPNGVEIISGPKILNTKGNGVDDLYGGNSNTYFYSVDNDANPEAEFYVNPTLSIYGGNFSPASGGTKCQLEVKAYAKKGITNVWQRTS